MKKKVFVIVIILLLVSIIIIQKNSKTDLYITLPDTEGINIVFNDSIAQKINKIEMSLKGDLSYQRWEIMVDSAKTEKINKEKLISHITCSQDFIIKNFGWNRDLIFDTKRFRIYIVIMKLNEPYILPVKDIRFIVE
jgi:hypothetical protein